MKSILEQLSSMTVVVADTGDLDAIKKFKPRDATTNPSLILAAAKNPNYLRLIDQALENSKNLLDENIKKDELVKEAIDQVSVLFGKEILSLIEGRVSTEVDARLSFDIEGTINKARKLVKYYKKYGIDKNRILIKIASTWEGIKAAEILEEEGIHCNLTLLFNFCQAVACANANVTLISPFVGRILDWHKLKTGKSVFLGSEDPGVISVTKIFNYFKEKGFSTEVMGASFRNIEEIKELAGCDLLTIAPKFLDELDNDFGELTKKLDQTNLIEQGVEYNFDEKEFRLNMLEDQMASEKLSEGITGFSNAIEELEALLLKRFSEINNENLISL
tara:strand:+ start:39919 stop:40917 length:999 start_codon:yes stop_codon:yes gene_type:complete